MNNLQSIRKSKGLTQKDLVNQTGISNSLITKYESGEKNINRAAAETLYIISNTLGCTIEDLLEKDRITDRKKVSTCLKS